MEKLKLNDKLNCKGMFAASSAAKIYPWNTAIYVGLVGQAINGLLGLTNQIVYNNNSNPKYHSATPYDDTSSRLYIRAGHNAMCSTMSIGSPFI